MVFVIADTVNGTKYGTNQIQINPGFNNVFFHPTHPFFGNWTDLHSGQTMSAAAMVQQLSPSANWYIARVFNPCVLPSAFGFDEIYLHLGLLLGGIPTANAHASMTPPGCPINSSTTLDGTAQLINNIPTPLSVIDIY